MYARLDDELIDHPKIFAAGKKIGRDGAAIALGVYALTLMWSNRHLTDGFVPTSTLEGFRHMTNPVAVADALVSAGLFEKVSGGFQVHDFGEHNPSAKTIKAKRKGDRIRKQRERAEANGHR